MARTKPFHECSGSEKRLHGHWMSVSSIYPNDPEAAEELYALDRRLDCKGYTFDLRMLRHAVRNEIGPMIYRLSRQNIEVGYETLVYIHVAEADDPIFKFSARVSLSKDDIFDGYEAIGSFAFGDAHNMNPDYVRDDRLYGDYLWPPHAG